MRYAIYYTLMCKEDSMNVETVKKDYLRAV